MIYLYRVRVQEDNDDVTSGETCLDTDTFKAKSERLRNDWLPKDQIGSRNDARSGLKILSPDEYVQDHQKVKFMLSEGVI